MAKTRIPKTAKGPFDPQKQVRRDYEYAKRCILEDNGVMPLFVVHGRDIVIPIGFGGGKEYSGKTKEGHRTMAQLVAVAHNAIAVAYIGEAWIASALPDEPEPEFPRVAPRDREDKREVIIAQLMWRDDDTGERLSCLAQGEIVRNAKAKCIRVDNEEFSEPTTELIGNFAEVLPPREPTPEQQEYAKHLLDELTKRGMAQRVDVRTRPN
jgi:hypothetical protein